MRMQKLFAVTLTRIAAANPSQLTSDKDNSVNTGISATDFKVSNMTQIDALAELFGLENGT
jgi:hypothetical protein